MSQQDKQQNERNYAGMMVKVYNWLREYQRSSSGARDWMIFDVAPRGGNYLFAGHGGKIKIGSPNTEFSVAIVFAQQAYRDLRIVFQIDENYSIFKQLSFCIEWGMDGTPGENRSNPDERIAELGRGFGFRCNGDAALCKEDMTVSEFQNESDENVVKKVLFDFLDKKAEIFKSFQSAGYGMDKTETERNIQKRIQSLRSKGLVIAAQNGDLSVPDTANYIAILEGDKETDDDRSAEETDKSDGDARGREVIILRWNPYKEEDGEPIWSDSEKALHAIQNGSSYPEDWSCHTTDVRKGDTIYIYKSKGKEEAGIVARGTVVSDRRVKNGEGRIDIEIDSMLDYTCEEYITWSTIKTLTKDGSEPKAFSPDRASGFPIPDVFDEKKIADTWNLLWLKKMLANESLNLIRFGAPGTGKSYEINKFFKEPGWSSKERVTFHPDYSYANFVGAYKPYMNAAKEGKEQEITYAFVPGPFTRVLVNALRDPNGKHLLVIEEINRANTAAVFGDIFQLLDRNAEGKSEYAISPSQDLAKFLGEALKHEKKNDDDWWWLTTEKPQLSDIKIRQLIRDLRIPSNMYLWATMNSADQGVFPMDTAFKRRWSFEYVGIDDGAKELIGVLPTQWNELRNAINKKLVKELKVNEDKCMGPFFLSKDNLRDVDTFLKVFKSKVLMYLFEDAARQKRKDVFADGLETLSEIFAKVGKIREGVSTSVFKDKPLNEALEKIIKNTPAKSNDENPKEEVSSTPPTVPVTELVSESQT